MLNIGLARAIPNIVETMLPRFSDPNLGLSITLDLRDNDYDYAPEKSSATIIRFIFQRPSNYTKVLVSYGFNNFPDINNNPKRKVIYFEKHSDHDSCWKSDGLNILNTHWNNVKKYFGKHPNEISSFYSFSIFDKIKYVEFETFEAVEQNNGFIKGYNIKIKREVPLNEVHKYLEREILL